MSMTAIYYLPEYHDFKYLAQAPWPRAEEFQLDWINSMEELEHWLEAYVGPHYAEWAYAQQQTYDYWQACIAFKRAEAKTLFLLRWT